jgi:hypothetical protein
MISGRRIISQFWEAHRKVRLVVAAVMCGILPPLIYLAVAAEPLKVAGLPVT